MKIFHFLILIGLFWSCIQNKNNELIGNWYRVENHQVQEIMILKEDSVLTSFDNFYNPIFYEVKSDTFYFHMHDAIKEEPYKYKNDTLFLFYSESNNECLKYVRCSSKKLLNSWNSELKMTVDIPIFTSEKFWWDSEDNTILLDNGSSKKVVFNGMIFPLDSSLYFKIADTSGYSYNFYAFNNLLIDKDVIYGDLKVLFKELSKAGFQDVNFLAFDSTSNLNAVAFRLPFVDFNWPDSIKELIAFQLPPPPPSESFNINYIDSIDIICEFYRNKLIVDNVEHTFEEFRNKLNIHLDTKNRSTLFVHFDDELRYEAFLEIIFNLKTIYTLKRDQYALETFGTSFYELENVEREAIWDLFPMRIRFIDEYQLNDLHNDMM